MQLDVWKELFELAEHVREDVEAGGFVGGDDEFAARHLLQFVDGILSLAAEIENLLGVFGKDLSGGGEGDARPQSLKEGCVEFLLKLPHLGADGRLCAKAGQGCFREALEADNLEESVKLV